MDEMTGSRASAGEQAAAGTRDTGEQLTHLRPEGGVRMVDIGDKSVTLRKAVARGEIKMSPRTLALICQGKVPKGDVLTAAQIAGIMAAKRTQELIPLCHQINLTGVDVELRPNPERSVVEVEAIAKLEGKTGAEMEALVAVAVSCLTVYDMCKAVDRGMEIGRIRLVEKSGGKSGAFIREEER